MLLNGNARPRGYTKFLTELCRDDDLALGADNREYVCHGLYSSISKLILLSAYYRIANLLNAKPSYRANILRKSTW